MCSPTCATHCADFSPSSMPVRRPAATCFSLRGLPYAPDAFAALFFRLKPRRLGRPQRHVPGRPRFHLANNASSDEIASFHARSAFVMKSTRPRLRVHHRASCSRRRIPAAPGSGHPDPDLNGRYRETRRSLTYCALPAIDFNFARASQQPRAATAAKPDPISPSAHHPANAAPIQDRTRIPYYRSCTALLSPFARRTAPRTEAPITTPRLHARPLRKPQRPRQAPRRGSPPRSTLRCTPLWRCGRRASGRQRSPARLVEIAGGQPFIRSGGRQDRSVLDLRFTHARRPTPAPGTALTFARADVLFTYCRRRSVAMGASASLLRRRGDGPAAQAWLGCSARPPRPQPAGATGATRYIGDSPPLTRHAKEFEHHVELRRRRRLIAPSSSSPAASLAIRDNATMIVNCKYASARRSRKPAQPTI